MLQNKTEDLEQSLLRYIKGMCKRCWIFWSNLYDFQSPSIWILTKCLLRCVSIPWFVSVVYFAFLVHWLCLCILFKRKKTIVYLWFWFLLYISGPCRTSLLTRESVQMENQEQALMSSCSHPVFRLIIHCLVDPEVYPFQQ